MGDVGADGRVQHHAGEMRSRAGAARSELHRSLILFGIGGKLLQIAHRQILAREDNDRHFRNQCDRREVGHGIVGRMIIEPLVLRVGAYRTDPYRVTVGPGVREPLHAGHAARAGDVLDDDGLPKDFPHALGKEPAEQIGGPTCSEGDDHCDGPRRIALGGGGAAKHQHERKRDDFGFHEINSLAGCNRTRGDANVRRKLIGSAESWPSPEGLCRRQRLWQFVLSLHQVLRQREADRDRRASF